MSHFLPEKTFWLASISWSYPYTDPPSGIRHLWACCIPSPCLDNHAPDTRPGCGYSITLDVMGNIKPAKKWSAAAKAKNRQRLMARRAEKKDPLFADWVINQKLASNPEYYDADKIADQSKKHRQMMIDRKKETEKKFIRQSIINASPDQMEKIEELAGVKT